MTDLIKVWISPQDLCLLTAIGEEPRCAHVPGGLEDHVLIGLTRAQLRTLWQLGGCRDARTGGPLLAPDGRLICAFEAHRYLFLAAVKTMKTRT